MRMNQSDYGKQPQCHLHSARCLSTKRRIFLRDKRTNTDHLRFQSTDKLQIFPQGIYGLITAFLIISKMGLLSGAPIELTVGQGIYFFAASLPIMIVGYFSAILQARVAASGINLLAKRPDEVGKAITSAAMVETYAIFAVLVSLLLVLFAKV